MADSKALTYWLLFLLPSFILNGCLVVCKSLGESCSGGATDVNCSYRGIIYNLTYHSSSFNCTVCCGLRCCQISRDISLKILRWNITPFYFPTQTRYSFTLNATNDVYCNKSNIARNGSSDSSSDVQCTDSYNRCNVQSNISRVFYTNNNICCRPNNLTTTCLDELDSFSGFNGSNNYLKELPSFDEWSKLQWIDLSNNDISFITKFIGKLSVLQSLSLSNNNIFVIIPSFFYHLSSLKYLHLNDNPAITEWTFVNNAKNLNIVDVKGSCNELEFLEWRITCNNNTTLITDNTSCIQNVANCALISSWPTIPDRVLSLLPCRNTVDEFYTSTTSTVSGVHGNTSSLNFCALLNANIPFLKNNDCTWISVSGALALFCICLVVVTLFRCRIIRFTGEGIYARQVYLPKKPGNKHELEMKGVREDEGRRSKENKCTRHTPSVELPAVPVAFDISECSSEADLYSECYYMIEENAVCGKIFSEKDMCMMVNLKTGLLYNRWMGTITLSKEHSKCVVFSAVTVVELQNKTVHWDAFVKRALELPKNKHLTNIEGMSIQQQTIYLVQEYLNCETLEARLKVKDGMDSSKTSIALNMMTSEVMRLILGILEGLELLQSYGFLHPGLSPKKVLLTNEGVCKLYDFCLDEDAGNIVKMKKSHIACDINQFAPEALLRNEYTKASDVWSTAVLFWEVLSESYPFSFDARTISVDELFPNPPSTWPDTYEALSNNKLFECWCVDPSLRPTIPELRSSFTEIFELLLTESTDNVSNDLMDGYIPMHRVGDSNTTRV